MLPIIKSSSRFSEDVNGTVLSASFSPDKLASVVFSCGFSLQATSIVTVAESETPLLERV